MSRKSIWEIILLVLSAGVIITKAVIEKDNAALETEATANEALNETNEE